jgi:membrane-bound lytic murein transglycosylase C
MRKIAGVSFVCCVGILSLAFPMKCHAQKENDQFDSFVRGQDSLFTQFADSITNQYGAFVKQQLADFRKFKEEIDRYWDDAVYPSNKDYVEYSDSFQSRLHIDFEKGDVRASVLIDDPGAPGSFEAAKAKLTGELQRAVTSPGRDKPYELADGAGEIGGRALLAGQVVDSRGRVVNAGQAVQYARDVIASAGITADTIISKDNRRRIKLTGDFKLVPDHLKKRAREHLPYASQFAKQYNLDLRLVLAIMHTESYFNPRATSRIPAFGLMQVVPGTAGRDAYKKVYGVDKLLGPDYLYDPRNNVELGCAYLNILRFAYLKDIAGDQEAYPCVIASYNGGIGTVCKALTGTKSLSNIAGSTKGASSDELVQQLNRKLPYQETRDYLNKVLERMALYNEWAR